MGACFHLFMCISTRGRHRSAGFSVAFPFGFMTDMSGWVTRPYVCGGELAFMYGFRTKLDF
jgi:hypothetical protein